MADNAGDLDYETLGTATTCGSSDATGTAGLQNQTYLFVAAGSNNFLFAAGSDGINEGTGLSGTFDDDILGNTRSGTWDIGFHEYGDGGANGGCG